MKRKLTTILFADAQGYSAQMAADDASTLERLKRYRAVMAGLFERHDGRQVNTWGDAVIAEFSSVVEAVRCAIEIQDSLATENRALPGDRQMWFRIGINLGDVIIDNENLYGEGVNVAQRLEALAEPGGIMVSGTVHGLVRKQLSVGFDFAGEQDIKNSDHRIPAYRVRIGGRNDITPNTAQDEHPGGEAGPQTQILTSAGRSPLDAAWTWFTDQPKRVRFAAGMIGVFFVINLLTTGLGILWFFYPSIPFAIYILLHVRRRGRSGGDAPY